ncbi:hypothetical protein AB674_21500 [Flavobacterium sp. ABG]|nr:hypothetical protein AB674_21500 [Flavobacterium sp. ABG]
MRILQLLNLIYCKIPGFILISSALLCFFLPYVILSEVEGNLTSLNFEPSKNLISIFERTPGSSSKGMKC